MALFGFIGVGNMGYPLLQGAIKAFGKENVIFTSATANRRQLVSEKTGIPATNSNLELVKGCKYLLLAMKPQFFPEVMEEIKEGITPDHVVISVAAGVTIDTMKLGLSGEARIIRSMPNTPSLVGEGMTGVCYSNDVYTDEEKDVLDQFFTSFGKYEVFDEKLMNAVICANGSSPAYVYLFMEALADSVVSYGIPRDKAYTLVSQTVLGAAKMLMETKEHPGKLKDNVCSPGGTTIAAVKALEEHGFRNAIMKASDACYQRAEDMNKKR